MKETVCTAIGLIGSLVTSLIGGWDVPMKALVICMIIDYISGLMVAGIFHKSRKSDNGALNSSIGMKGLCKKCMVLFWVIVMAQVGKVTNMEYLRNALIIGFIANEFISIAENSKLMGIPLPKPIFNAIDVLTERSERNEN